MRKVLLFISPILFLISCSDGGGGNGSTTDNQISNRTSLLENVTNNIIIPSYNNLIEDINNLSVTATSFSSNPTQQTLDQVRKAWVKTYVTWQAVEMFNINLAEEMEYYKTMNTYPCTPGYIDNNISSGSYDLSSITDQSRKSQGLPALDYMLYGLDTDTNAIINYYVGVNGSNYCNYLNDLIQQMQTNTNAIIADWQNEKSNFINSSGNSATSSFNKLTNDFVYYYEKGFRANKIGIPVGKWNAWAPYQAGVEARYRKDISKRLAQKALISCKDFFTGKSMLTGATGYSYVDFLADHEDQTLSNDILSKMELAKTAVDILDNNFISHLTGNNSPMIDAYDAIQQVVPLLKVEMFGVLQVDPDYADSDGD